MILFTASGALAEAFCNQYDCKIISARLVEDKELSENIKKATVIVHNAALIVSDDLGKFVNDNFGLTKKIVDMALKCNPNVKFINISSMSFLKDDENYMDPQSMSNYAFSKYLAELYCLKQSLSVCNVRFSTLFYGDHKKDGLSNLAYQAITKKEIVIYNNAEARRDFIPIDIAAQYLFKLVKTSVMPKILNIVSGKSIEFNFFVKKIIEFDNTVKINNMITLTPDVLHTFSHEGIRNLGEINFDIEDSFKKYILKLYESFNI